MQEKIKKWVLRGGILGLVYPILAQIVILPFGLVHDKLPVIIQAVIFLVSPPLITYNFFHIQLDRRSYVDSTTGEIFYAYTGSTGFLVNILLWIAIGAFLGYLYGRWRSTR